MASYSQQQQQPPPPPPANPTTPAVFNAREVAILPHILLCSKEDPSRLQFDWAKLAQRMGMKNPRSAANSWLAVRKKIEAISSATAATAAGNHPPKLTQHDQRFLANAVSCTKRPLVVDNAALAAKLGMQNPRSAANAWGLIKKKIEAGSGSAAAGGGGDRASSSSFVTKPTAAKRKSRVRRSGLKAREDQLRVQSVEAPAPATVPPFAYKVVKKRESETRDDEKRTSGCGVERITPDSDAYSLSLDQALSTRHIHMMALAATDEAESPRVKAESESFGEC